MNIMSPFKYRRFRIVEMAIGHDLEKKVFRTDFSRRNLTFVNLWASEKLIIRRSRFPIVNADIIAGTDAWYFASTSIVSSIIERLLASAIVGRHIARFFWNTPISICEDVMKKNDSEPIAIAAFTVWEYGSA